MMSDNDFIEQTWKKYEMNMKKPTDSFYKKHQYKFIETVRIIKTTIISVLSVMVLSGAVYAGYVGVNNYLEGKLLKGKSINNINDNKSNIYLDDMIYDEKESVYYKIINNYNEYVTIKNNWSGLLDLKDEDFINSFIVIIKPAINDLTNKTPEYRVSDIETLDNELKIYIDLVSKYNIDNILIKDDVGKIIGTNEKSSLVLELSREIYRDNIFIINNYLKSNNEYIPLEDIHSDYSQEKSVNDGCFVIKKIYGEMESNDFVISNDSKLIDKFIDSANNNEKAFIRIVFYPNDNQIIIKDISYKNGEYILKEKYLDKITENEQNFNYVFSNAKIEDENYHGKMVRILKFYKISGLSKTTEKEQLAYKMMFRDYKETATD